MELQAKNNDINEVFPFKMKLCLTIQSYMIQTGGNIESHRQFFLDHSGQYLDLRNPFDSGRSDSDYHHRTTVRQAACQTGNAGIDAVRKKHPLKDRTFAYKLRSSCIQIFSI